MRATTWDRRQVRVKRREQTQGNSNLPVRLLYPQRESIQGFRDMYELFLHCHSRSLPSQIQNKKTISAKTGNISNKIRKN
jgi:hypothetical protein